MSFLTLSRYKFDTVGRSKAAAVFVITYLLNGDARELSSERFVLVEYDFDGGSAEISDHGTWPNVVLALLRRFLIDDVLRKTQDAVTRTGQYERKDGTKFAEIASKAAGSSVICSLRRS